MPHDLHHGQWVKPTLALIASNHCEHSAQIRLWTDRLEVDQERATRTSSLYRNPVGFDVGSPLAVCHQHPVAHAGESRNLHTDGTGESSLRHLKGKYAEGREYFAIRARRRILQDEANV
jgi:hypothetical protein